MKKISLLAIMIFSIVLKSMSQDVTLCYSKYESITLFDNGNVELIKKDKSGKEIEKLTGTYFWKEYKENGYDRDMIEIKFKNTNQVSQYSVMSYGDGKIARLTERTGKTIERHFEYSRFGCDDYKPQY